MVGIRIFAHFQLTNKVGNFVRRLCENVGKLLELRFRLTRQKLRLNENNNLADCDFRKSAIFAPNTELNDVFTQPLRIAVIWERYPSQSQRMSA